jgi:1,4-dihydroxy-2-naphthoate octaprenyltransferase
MTPIKIWIDASRPKTLPAAMAPVIMGAALAIGDHKFHFLSALVALICALLIQIGTNFANDYYDFIKGADNHKRTGPVRATAAGLVAPQTMRKAFILIFSITFLLGLYLVWRGGWPILLIGILSIISGILYTGGPYPLGYNGLGDLFVLIFFGPVAVGGTYYVQALEIHSHVLWIGLAPGLISTAILTVNNLRDYQTDLEAGKRTLAVRLGESFARLEYIFSILLAVIIPIAVSLRLHEHYSVLLVIGVLLPAFKMFKRIYHETGASLNAVLAATGKLLFLYSILFTFGWLM